MAGRTSIAFLSLLFPSLLNFGLTGCGNAEKPDSNTAEKPKPPVTKPITPIEPKRTPTEALRRKLKIDRFPVPPKFEGGAITELSLQYTDVDDLSALQGLPLRKLDLNYTRVTDLSPLAGMPLRELNLQGTRVSDVSVLKTLELHSLWLNDTKVTSLDGLKGAALVSLDVSGTKISDLSPLTGMDSLLRLNLARSAVTDLAPLKGLKLQRIIFDPDGITNGLDVVRNMPTIVAIHTRFPDRGQGFLKPNHFWTLYDQGRLPR